MATLAIIPVEEYLRTTYRPDCDYIDGEVRERNVGEKQHSWLQGRLYTIFYLKLREWRLLPLTEQRVQVSARNYRIPDICLIRPDDPDPAIVRRAPVLCIEILSRDDGLSDMQARVDDYLAMGVENVWLIDPLLRRAYYATVRGFAEERVALTIAGTPVAIQLADLFAELDDLLAGRL